MTLALSLQQQLNGSENVGTPFVHLRVHSEYSLLSSCCRTRDIVDAAQAAEMPAVALTDAGNMFGTIEFFSYAKQRKIHPIIGLDPYVVSGSRFDHKTAKEGEVNFRIALLAENEQGYRNLMKLASIGYTEGFYYRPRIDMDVLTQHAEGLICLSGFVRGPVGYYIMSQQDDKALAHLDQLQSIFGKENLYLEVQRHGLPEREVVVQAFKKLSQEHGIPLVATNDVFYTKKEDSFPHEVLLCLQSGKTLNDDKRLRFPSSEFYFKSGQEMADLFPDMPEAISNTLEIAKRCQVSIDFGARHLPKFPVPQGYTSETLLKEMCEKAMPEKYPKATAKEQDRLAFELKTIADMGFPDYFLIVSDFIRYAKKQDIPVGPGRGSAAGSIVSYLLDITSLDPLRYDLLFERFLNPARISMPDIDIDFCKNKRNDVIAYVTEKYGRECVAQIITFGTMAAKMVLRDVGRVLSIPLPEVDRLAKLIPNDPKVKLKDALNDVPELKEAYETQAEYRRLFDIALTLEGMVRQPGIHAAGIIISAESLTNMTPLYKSGEDITTQYEATCLEDLGLLKMDFLGLKNLTVIADACAMIARNHNKIIDINTIPLDDKKTYDLLSAGKTIGVFQLESDGMRHLAKNMGVESFEVIVALLALYRPGPLDWAPDFIERKKGRQEIQYLHPLMEVILKETYGVMLYQEQVMQAVSELAGFSLAEADLLRRAMGKKKEDVMAAQREKFVKGCLEKNQMGSDLANKIFDTIYKFAGYGFNKSHSAAYAFISYQTAYLKANYPVEYMASLLTHSMDNMDKVVLFIAECRSMGIAVLAPDVNESFAAFTVVKEGIRFGLSAVKNVGTGAIADIVAAREKDKRFRSLFDFCRRVDLRQLNKRVMESLIKAGALDSLGAKRSQMASVLDSVLDMSAKEQKDLARGQTSLFDLMETDEQSDSSEALPDMPEWTESVRLGYEKDLIGLYLTGHPLKEYEDLLQLYSTATSVTLERFKTVVPATPSYGAHGARDDQGALVRMGGLIVDVRSIITRKGEKMAFIKIEDMNGTFEVTAFPKTYDTYKELMLVDQAVFLEGRASLNARNQAVQVILSKMVHLKNVQAMYTDMCCVKVNTADWTEQKMHLLKSLLSRYHGDCPVRMELSIPQKGRVMIEMGKDYTISPHPQLKKDIENLMGEGSVLLEGAKS